eukprot:Filipodium_phascolosomae@DN1106_c0_g1_i1.p1
MKDFSMSNFEKPTAESVRQVYQTSLEQFWDVPKEELTQMPFASLRFFKYPEIYGDAVPMLIFLRHMQRFLSVCGVVDFGLHDLNKPEPKRIRRHLMAIVNFARFKEERIQQWASIQDERDELLLEKAKLQERSDKFSEESKMYRQRLEKDLPDIQQCTKKRAASEQKIDIINRKLQQINQEIDSKKSGLADLEKRVKEEDENLAALKQEIQFLRSQVVHSPEKLRQQMSETSKAKQNERKYVADLLVQQRTMSDRASLLEQAEQKLKRILPLQSRLSKMWNDLRVSQQQAEIYGNDVSVTTARVEALRTTCDDSDRRINIQQEKVLQHDKWYEEQRKEVEVLSTTYQSAEVSREEEIGRLMKESQKLVENNKHMKLEIERKTSAHKNEMTTLVGVCSNLIKAMSTFEDQLLSRLGMNSIRKNHPKTTPLKSEPCASGSHGSSSLIGKSSAEARRHSRIPIPKTVVRNRRATSSFSTSVVMHVDGSDPTIGAREQGHHIKTKSEDFAFLKKEGTENTSLHFPETDTNLEGEGSTENQKVKTEKYTETPNSNSIRAGSASPELSSSSQMVEKTPQGTRWKLPSTMR